MAATTPQQSLEHLMSATNWDMESVCSALLDFIRKELGYQHAPMSSAAALLFAQQHFPPLMSKVLGADPLAAAGVPAMLLATKWYDGNANLSAIRGDAVRRAREQVGPRSPRGLHGLHIGGRGGGVGSSKQGDSGAFWGVSQGTDSVGVPLPVQVRVMGMTRDGAAIFRMLTSFSPETGITVFDVVWRNHAVHYNYSLALLPLPRRAEAERLPGAVALVQSNEALCSRCLSIPLGQQLRAFAEERHALEMRAAYDYGNVSPTAAALQQQPMQMKLRMCEYFCFAFARYAAVTPLLPRSGGNRSAGSTYGAGSRTPPPCGSSYGGGSMSSRSAEEYNRAMRMLQAWQRYGVLGLTLGNPYNSLVLDYARHFFAYPLPPRPPEQPQTAAGGSRRGRYSGSASSQALPEWGYSDRVALGAAVPAASGNGGEMGPDEELFLRAAAEFWLNQNQILLAKARHEDIERAAAAAAAATPQWMGAAPAYGAVEALVAEMSHREPRDPTEVEVIGEYIPPPDLALHALLVLCTHLLADPALRSRSARGLTEAAALAAADHAAGGGAVVAAAADARVSPLAGNGRAWAGGRSARARQTAVSAALPPEAIVAASMTPALAALQPMVFDFLRAAICNCVGDSQPSLWLALELWLLWLQPWAAPAVLEGLSPRGPIARGTGFGGPSGGGADAGSGSGGGSGSGLTHARQGSSGGGRGGSGGGMLGGLPHWLQGAQQGADALRGSYSDDWRSWVVANREFYVTLLVCFMKRAPDLPFAISGEQFSHGGGGVSGGGGGSMGGSGSYSGQSYGGGHSGGLHLHLGGGGGGSGVAEGLDMASRAIAVYTQEIRDVLNQSGRVADALDRQAAVLMSGEQREPLAFPREFGAGEIALVRAAREVMWPSLGGATCYFEDYVPVGVQLAEEMTTQLLRADAARHRGAILGGIRRGTEAHQKQELVLRGIRTIFNLLADWQPRATSDAGAAPSPLSKGARFLPERSALCPAYLTAEGRKQLRNGQRRCRVSDDVLSYGDPLSRPLLPSEFGFAAAVLSRTSRRLNELQERLRVGAAAYEELQRRRAAREAEVMEEYDRRPLDERPSLALMRARAYEEARFLGPGPYIFVNLRDLFADRSNFCWALAALLLSAFRLMRWVYLVTGTVAILAWGIQRVGGMT